MKKVTLMVIFFLMTLIPACAQQRANSHKPALAPEKILPPFIVLPFDKSEAHKLRVINGYVNSTHRQNILSEKLSRSVSTSAPEGTPLYAPCSGWAVRGFHTQMAMDSTYPKQPRLLNEHTIGIGQGHFVQITCKINKVFLALSNLQEASDKIPSVPHDEHNGFYNPRIYRRDIGKTSDIEAQGFYVERGDYIGKVGHSGFGSFSYPLGSSDYERPETYYPYSWVTANVSIEVYERDAIGQKDQNRRWDPFGWYDSIDNSDGYKNFAQSEWGLFETEKDGTIKFARK